MRHFRRTLALVLLALLAGCASTATVAQQDEIIRRATYHGTRAS